MYSPAAVLKKAGVDHKLALHISRLSSLRIQGGRNLFCGIPREISFSFL